MVKILQTTFFAFLLILSLTVQAQDTLLLETFDDSTLGQFTQYSEVGEGEMWEARDFGDKFFAQMNGFNGGVQENIDWLISPGIDMDASTNEVLAFENATNFSGPDLELLVSTDYTGEGDPTLATWTDLTDQAAWSQGDYEYVQSGDIDLSTLTDIAYIAFRYVSSDSLGGKLYQIDSVSISGIVEPNFINTIEIADKISTPYVNNNDLMFTVLEGEVSIAISSINGNMISELSNQTYSGETVVALGDIPSGVYALIVSSEGTLKTYKFFK